MSSINESLNTILSTLPEQVQLVAVSKTKPLSALQEAYDAGQRVFGENKVQELVEKAEALPQDIEWHMIGHLQRNKVKYIAPFVSLIHGVDSVRLLNEINKQGAKANRIIPVLLQFHIAQEESKFGFNKTEVDEFLSSETFASLTNISIKGVMGMATNSPDENVVRAEFKNLKHIFVELQSQFFKGNKDFKHISMGMSGDYPLAIEEGSTMVRVGSAIFGKRNYPT